MSECVANVIQYTFVRTARYSTQVWAKFFSHFDGPGCVERSFTSWANNPRSKYNAMIANSRDTGMTDTQIKASILDMWALAGKQASSEGTALHRNIELFLNGRAEFRWENELAYFHSWLLEVALPRGWRPYRTEWSIYSTEYMVAGQIDSLWIDDNGSFHMVDWKRVRDDLRDGLDKPWVRPALGVLSDLKDAKITHYFIQQKPGLIRCMCRYACS